MTTLATGPVPPTSAPRREARLAPPGWQMARACRDTAMLVRMRWRALRSARARSLVYAGLGVVFLALFMASQVGTAIWDLSQSRSGTAAQRYALLVMSQLHEGHLTGLASAAFATAVAAAMLSPFTGTANAPLYPPEDVAALRPARMHVFTDSLITQTVSAVGFLSLFALTALASILTATGGRLEGLAVTWCAWPVLLSLGVAESWCLEFLRRRFGQRGVRTAIGLLCVAVAVAVSADRSSAATLFGLGDRYASQIADGVRHGSRAVGTFALICLALTATLLLIGAVACHHGLRYQQPVPEQSAPLWRRARMPFRGGQTITAVQLVLTTLLRTPHVVRPLAAVVVVAIPALWLTGSGVTATTVVLGVPLVVTVSWAVNAFGLIGPGMSWLASTPLSRRALLYAAVLTHLLMVAVLFLAVWLPPVYAGRVSPGVFSHAAAGALTATLMCGRSAIAKSIYRPVRASLTGSSATVVPPMRALGYALRLTAWGGQIGILVFEIPSPATCWLAAAGAAVWVCARYAVTARRFERGTAARVVAAVADQ